MDINFLTQFIKNSRGLRLDKMIFYKTLIFLPIMFLLVIINAQELGNVFVVVSVVVLLFILVSDVFYFFAMFKNSLPKYKLLLMPVILSNCVAPLFYICCLIFYNIFGLKSFLLYYFFPFFAISFAFIAVNFGKSLRAIRQKSKASYSLLCGILLGLSVWISRKANKLMAEKMSENAHFVVIAISMLLVGGIAFSIAVLDLWRYYYFTKLEKMGLVTEDILKPDKP